jgi:hypothetical protein
MGTAVIEGGMEVEFGNSFAEGKGSASTEVADAASACHSFWEEVGREAGAIGARLSAGLAQQAGVEHFPCLPPQHLHIIGAGEVAVGPADTPCQDVATLIRTASRIVTVLERRADIRFV